MQQKALNLGPVYTFKNYRDLCRTLNLDIKKGGNSKTAQLNFLNRYIFNLEKSNQGNSITAHQFKFLIPYETYYSENASVHEIIADILYCYFRDNPDKDFIHCTENQLYELLGMVNSKYISTRKNTYQFKKAKEETVKIKNYYMRQFFSDSSNYIRSLFFSANLKTLKQESIINYEKTVNVVLKICYKNHQKAFLFTTNTLSQEEQNFLFNIKKEQMDKMGVENMWSLIHSKKYSEYIKRVKETIQSSNAYAWCKYYEYYYEQYLIKPIFLEYCENRLPSSFYKHLLNSKVYKSMCTFVEKQKEKALTTEDCQVPVLLENTINKNIYMYYEYSHFINEYILL